MNLRFPTLVALAAVALPLRESAAQYPCEPERVDLVFQGSAVEGPAHQTEELYARAVGAVRVPVEPGEVGRATLGAGIVSRLEREQGVAGWSIAVVGVGDVVIRSATTDGTAAAPAPEGLLGQDGFVMVWLRSVPPVPSWCVTSEVMSGVVLSFTQPVTLAPRGTATIIRLEVEARGEQGAAPLGGALEWRPDCCRICPNMACGQPCSGATVTVLGAGERVACEVRETSVTFYDRTRAPFARGDSNSDGRVDISDAIRTFMYLFLGAREPICLDAADATDDGAVDISDGIAILLDFFRPGTGIPEPGPFECGFDPTPDALTCMPQLACERQEGSRPRPGG